MSNHSYRCAPTILFLVRGLFLCSRKPVDVDAVMNENNLARIEDSLLPKSVGDCLRDGDDPGCASECQPVNSAQGKQYVASKHQLRAGSPADKRRPRVIFGGVGMDDL